MGTLKVSMDKYRGREGERTRVTISKAVLRRKFILLNDDIRKE